jgi:hypothetical protein
MAGLLKATAGRISQLHHPDRVEVVMIVRQRLASVSALIVFVALSPMALAAGWSSVQTRKNSFLDGLGCRSTRWCMGVGTGRTGLTAAFWNGRRWKLIARPRLPAHAEGGSLSAVTCPLILGVLRCRPGSSPSDPRGARWSFSAETSASSG